VPAIGDFSLAEFNLLRGLIRGLFNHVRGWLEELGSPFGSFTSAVVRLVTFGRLSRLQYDRWLIVLVGLVLGLYTL